MSLFYRVLGSLFVAVAITAQAADESFATLKVKDDVYTKVTVTSVTATEIYFWHARGLASAKLKDLSPDLQKHFHYDADKSAQVESAQRQATIEFSQRLATAKPVAPKREIAAAPNVPADDDFVAPDLHARSVRGQRPPTFAAEKWLTVPPAVEGKFVLVDFWATWCGPCKETIPELNSFSAKFKDRLVIIGLSNESEEDIRKMTSPQIDYTIASDTQSRLAQQLQVTAIPHCILVDPSGIVRYEGMPEYLNEQILRHFLDKYSH